MKRKPDTDEMRPEYTFDYSKGVRGKYYKRMMEGPVSVTVAGPDGTKVRRVVRAGSRRKRSAA